MPSLRTSNAGYMGIVRPLAVLRNLHSGGTKISKRVTKGGEPAVGGSGGVRVFFIRTRYFLIEAGCSYFHLTFEDQFVLNLLFSFFIFA